MNDTKTILNELAMFESKEQKIDYLRSIKRVPMDDSEIILALLEESFEEQHEKRRFISPNHTTDYLIANGVTVQKHGRWISEKCNHKPHRIKNPEKWVIYKCSACGYSNGRKQSNYCPNCGAKMDG